MVIVFCSSMVLFKYVGVPTLIRFVEPPQVLAFILMSHGFNLHADYWIFWKLVREPTHLVGSILKTDKSLISQVLNCQILILIYLDVWNFHPSKFSILKPHKFNKLLRNFIWVDYQFSCSSSFGGNSEYMGISII